MKRMEAHSHRVEKLRATLENLYETRGIDTPQVANNRKEKFK